MRKAPWQRQPLEAVARLIRGITFSSADKSEPGTVGTIPCLRTSNIQETLVFDDLLWVDAEFVRREEQWLQSGDTIISMANSYQLVGKVAFNPGQSVAMSFGGFIAAVRPEGVFPKYLYYALRSPDIQAAIRAGATHTVNISNISARSLKGVEVPLAPPEVQSLVAAVIDTHFSRLDAAVASLTHAKTNVKRARASVLKAAIDGRLVPGEAALARLERRAYEAGSALLCRILDERAAHPHALVRRGKVKIPIRPSLSGLPLAPEGWIWTSLDTVILRIEGGNAATATSETGSRRVLRSSAVRQGKVDWSDYRFLPRDAPQGAEPFVSTGDLLFTRLSGSLSFVGNCAFVTHNPERYEFPDRIFRAVPASMVSGAYLQHCFEASHLRTLLESKAKSTAGHQRISLADLREFAIPLPPLAEQHRIVAEVDRRLSVLDALAATIDTNLARCAMLRQAILKRAFEGRLVPAEPSEPSVSSTRRTRTAPAPTTEPQLPLFAQDTPR